MVDFKYELDEKIEAWTEHGTWREATVISRKEYRGRPSYQILWNLPPNMTENEWPSTTSRGGSTNENSMRKKPNGSIL